jgi:hypothetical protein
VWVVSEDEDEGAHITIEKKHAVIHRQTCVANPEHTFFVIGTVHEDRNSFCFAIAFP